MNPADFRSEAPGSLIRTPDGYWSYVPNPLPPKITFDARLVKSLSEADQALGELRGVGRMLPNPHLLIRPFLRREAVSSSAIEGTQTTFEQLLLFEADPSSRDETGDRLDAIEVGNYVSALEYGLGRLAELPVCLRLIKEVHAILMQGVRGEDKRPGEFRDRPSMVAREGQTPAEARFVPPPVPEMHQALHDLEQFVGNPPDLPVLVQLALIHYQFEAIHPFLDGNGRIGRLLISLLLCERQCLTKPTLYLSAYFERYREDYVDHLLAVSREGAWSDWIDFFLRGVAAQAAAAVDRCDRLLTLRQRYREMTQNAGHPALLLRLVDQLFDTPLITVTGTTATLDAAFHTAQKYVEKLVELKIVTEVTGKPRNRVFAATDIVAILNEKA